MGCIEHGELLELGAEGNLSSLHQRSPQGGQTQLPATKGLSDVVCALLVPGVLFFHLHPHSRHTLGCSFSLGHGGEDSEAHKWEFSFPGKPREDRMWIPGSGVGFPWFYSQSQLDQPFRWSMTMIREAFPAGYSFCSYSMFLRCSLESHTMERGE